MQPYQEEYIANIKEALLLFRRRNMQGKTFDEFYNGMLLEKHRLEQLTERNMLLLRESLFPVLDNIFEADENELKELRNFAAQLLAGRGELDAGLACQIHKALLSFARHNKDRSAMIRELYWLGMGYHHFCSKLVGIEKGEDEKYSNKMRMCFTEAAAYLKYYDEIDDSETRGYILRSRANMALGKFKTVGDKIRMVKRTLMILQDKEYQEKAPDLPWDRYIYLTHQQMAASMSYSINANVGPQEIVDVMESVYIVYQQRLQDAAEKNEHAPIRSRFSCYAVEQYCGLHTIDELLTEMEKLMDNIDASDYSDEGIYGIISLLAYYCQYLSEVPDLLPKRTEYIESLYQRVLYYVEFYPDASGSESLFFALRQLSYTFLETEHSILYKDFLMKLQIRFTPQIYVHSWAVGSAAAALCGIIMDEEPDFFDDMDFICEVTLPEEKKRAVIQYARECGILHDIGKMNFVSLYSQTVRQWFEEEDGLTQLHTMIGMACLQKRPSTVRYAAIAQGHHDWYDGSRHGYSHSYVRLECPYRQMVDVIGLVDWLDNITDAAYIYNGVKKTVEQAIEEAVSLEGRRFSPLLTARLRDKRVCDEIKTALEKGRLEAYRNIYEVRVKK